MQALPGIYMPRSHYSGFVMMRFCCIKATPFLYKNEEKNIRFCAFILISLIENTEPKISVFVRSRCSSFVKVIVGYHGVFKNIRFCGYPLLIAFSKTSVFVAFLCRSV